jgi:DNA-binding CsgD family transcriptional regulator
VLDHLALLVDKSLVQADNTCEHTRYRMLKTIRHYALEKLGESGEADAIRTAHRDYFTGLAATLDSPGRSDFRMRVEQVEAEMENLRAAFGWSQDRGEFSRALELASSLQPLWQGRGHLREGLLWFGTIFDDNNFELEMVEQPLSARALADKAVLDAYTSAENIEHAQQAVGIARDIGDPALLARALTARGCAGGFDADLAAPYLAEAIDLARAIRDDWRLSQILARQAYIAAMTGNPAATTALAEEGQAVADAVGDWLNSDVCRWALSMAKMMRADLDGAADGFRATLAAAENNADLIGVLLALVSLNSTLVFLGAIDEAKDVARMAELIGAKLDISSEGAAATIVAFTQLAAGNGIGAYATISAAWRHPSVRRGTVSVALVAQTALAAGDLDAAQAMADEAVATMAGWYKVWALSVRVRVALSRGDSEQALRDTYEALALAADCGGQLLVPDLFECLAGLASSAAKHTEAARFLGAAHGMRHRTGEIRLSIQEEAYQATVTSTREALSDSEFDAGWSQGATLSTSAAIAYALRGRGERRRPASGWASLTPAELDVVRLVGEGLPNKEIAERLFVSPRTVQAHLTHVYNKLGVNSRVQLAQEAARRVER